MADRLLVLSLCACVCVYKIIILIYTIVVATLAHSSAFVFAPAIFKLCNLLEII